MDKICIITYFNKTHRIFMVLCLFIIPKTQNNIAIQTKIKKNLIFTTPDLPTFNYHYKCYNKPSKNKWSRERLCPFSSKFFSNNYIEKTKKKNPKNNNNLATSEKERTALYSSSPSAISPLIFASSTDHNALKITLT